MIDELREAARAINEGDPEPFLALFDEDTDWSGEASGPLWRRDTPRCHGVAEARGVVALSTANRQFPRQVDPEFVQLGAEAVLSVTTLLDANGVSAERYHVFIFRGDRIREMRAFKSRRAAERFVTQRSRQGRD